MSFGGNKMTGQELRKIVAEIATENRESARILKRLEISLFI